MNSLVNDFKHEAYRKCFLSVSIDDAMSLPKDLNRLLSHIQFLGFTSAVFCINTANPNKLKNSNFDIEKFRLSIEDHNDPINNGRLEIIIASQLTYTNTGHFGIFTKDAYFKRFQFLIVKPTNLDLFKHACESPNIDAISISFSKDFRLFDNKKLIKSAMEKGIFFFFDYSSILLSDELQETWLSEFQKFAFCQKHQNVLLITASERLITLKSPRDLMNMAKLCKYPLKKNYNITNINLLLEHAERRRYGNGLMTINKKQFDSSDHTDSLTEQERPGTKLLKHSE
ncbi:MAG: hypothetical protein MHMPM18_001625 [Marteilia pararefringens]